MGLYCINSSQQSYDLFIYVLKDLFTDKWIDCPFGLEWTLKYMDEINRHQTTRICSESELDNQLGNIVFWSSALLSKFEVPFWKKSIKWITCLNLYYNLIPGDLQVLFLCHCLFLINIFCVGTHWFLDQFLTGSHVKNLTFLCKSIPKQFVQGKMGSEWGRFMLRPTQWWQ